MNRWVREGEVFQYLVEVVAKGEMQERGWEVAKLLIEWFAKRQIFARVCGRYLLG